MDYEEYEIPEYIKEKNPLYLSQKKNQNTNINM